jgi:hypothetical protein
MNNRITRMSRWMPSIVFVGELVIVERIDDSIERCGVT